MKKSPAQYAILSCFILLIQSCATSTTKTLEPITEQNGQNISSLSNNVQVLLTLTRPLLQATGQSLLYQHIGKTEQEMLAVVGAPLFAPNANVTWKGLFEKQAERPGKYLARYQFIKTALERGLAEDEIEKLKSQEGWIYEAATNVSFTPQIAHQLLKSLLQAKSKAKGNPSIFYQKAAEILTPHDPKLVAYQRTIEGANLVLKGLEEEIDSELVSAGLHAQAIENFVGNKINLQESIKNTVAGIDQSQVVSILNKVSGKYFDNPSFKDAAINFLLGQTQRLIFNRL